MQYRLSFVTCRHALFTLSLCAVCATLLAGCSLIGSGSEKTEDGAQDGMSIEVKYSDSMHRCSRVSPEITVRNIPAGTDSFVVRLIEADAQERYCGGGSWRNDGTGVIPEGALTQHYQGPCPQAGQKRTYHYVVSAMENGNPQPLMVRVFPVTPEVQ